MLVSTPVQAQRAAAASPTLRTRSRSSLRLYRHARSPRTPPKATLDDAVTSSLPVTLATLPPEYLIGGALVAALGIGAFAFAVQQQNAAPTTAAAFEAASKKAEAKLPREDAVLVVGSTGKTGIELVKQLLAMGRTVVAAVRDNQKAFEKFNAAGITVGRQSASKGILFLEEGVDITNPTTLQGNVFKGVTQVVACVGPVYGRNPDEYIDNMTPERVDEQGVRKLVNAAQSALANLNNKRTCMPLISLKSEADVAKWEVVTDGKSNLSIAYNAANGNASWFGELVLDGDAPAYVLAFTRAPADLSGTTGLALRIKGDGRTYKLNVRTSDLQGREDVYQATFETTGDWQTVCVPWHSFVLMNKTNVVPGPALDRSKVLGYGLMLSRYEFSGFPNPTAQAGAFACAVESIQAYKDPVPRFVLVSSAAAERNARIGDDKEQREADIPIVKLNPGGILNYKYAGEIAVRSSGLPYTVVRPTGLLNPGNEDSPALLEASQGDVISGLISRSELAELTAIVLNTALSTNRTFEVRRGLGVEAKGKVMQSADYTRMLLATVPDAQRTAVGLPPFPKAVPYEAPEPAPAAAPAAAPAQGSSSNVEEARAWIAAWRASTASKLVVPAPASAASAAPANVEDARAWIAAWRASSAAAPAPAAANGRPSSAGTQTAAPTSQVPANVQDAREWIRVWRAKTLESQLPKDSKVEV